MKPEPLKSYKVFEVNIMGYGTEINEKFLKEQDIKSAVEWLKKKIKTIPFNKGYHEQCVLEFIDEAFEDVAKEKEK